LWEDVNEGFSDLVISTVYFGGSRDLFVATWNGGLYRSTSNGEQWSRIHEAGIPSRLKGIVVSSGGTLFVGTRGYGAFRSVQSVLTVGAEHNGIPRYIDLRQNYPNPFNPSTTIRFSIPWSAEVSLKIFNLLGEEVATLVSGLKDAGTHTVQWDATGHPSGVYFYRLRAGEFIETKKLILMR